MNQKNKDLWICLGITLTGTYGSLLDFKTSHTILPSLWRIDEKLEYSIFTREYEMSSVWFLFTLFGIILITINILDLKSKYKGKALLNYWKKIVGDKLNEGKNEYKIWRRNRN